MAFRSYCRPPVSSMLPQLSNRMMWLRGKTSALSASQQSRYIPIFRKINSKRFAEELYQIEQGVKVPPSYAQSSICTCCVKIHTSGWKCSMCDVTDNLWMNLTDGSILCGRKYADGLRLICLEAGRRRIYRLWRQRSRPRAFQAHWIPALR